MLLEKLWAKATGNYEMSISGWPTEAIRFLTGAPSYSYYVSSYTSNIATTFWGFITAGAASNYILTASTPASTTGATFNTVGLVNGHAYTVETYVTLTCTNGTTIQLVKLRNPWGSDANYIGSWSDYDTTWNTAGQTYATQASWVNNTADGVFFININDFITYYQALVVSMYNSGYVNSIGNQTSDTGTWSEFTFTLATA